MHRVLIRISSFFILVLLGPALSQAEEKVSNCTAADRPCLMRQIESLAPRIEKQDWKDQSLRELAKTYVHEGQTDKAIALIEKIQTPDTRAMTIRGIGMAAASQKWERRKYNDLFVRLADQAAKIDHPPSRGIAYTYIAMAQAFAGDDEAARKTAAAMENAALRNKALGETAEIEAERGDLKNVLISLAATDSPAYRNKAYDTVSRIFLNKDMIEEAYICANKIDNAYLKVQSIQRILNKGNDEESDMEPQADSTKDF